MFRSATFKLTIWYIALVMAISIIFSIILYGVGSAQIRAGFNRESARISNQFPVFENNPMLLPKDLIADSDHTLLLRLVSFNIIVLFAAGFGSYALARRTLQPIEEAHEQQKRFTADVSHELRTPLTALRMETEVALMNPHLSKEDLKQTLSSNLEETNKLEILINNILRLTRLEADELRSDFTTILSESIIEAAVNDTRKIAERRDIRLKWRQGSNFMVAGDKPSLVQVLVILIDNAIKYSTDKSEVIIESATRDGRGILRIIDSGVGIAPENLVHIFDRFYRADQSRQRKQSGGYGLGLSIAKMIADVHSGSIVIASQPGHGTTAELVLPLTAPSDSSSAASLA